jgi:hypothetical protein
MLSHIPPFLTHIHKCPYSDTCPPLTRAQLTQHMATCTHIPCPHKVAGCTFEGTKSALDEHMENCGYESIKVIIAKYVKFSNREIREIREFHENLVPRIP